jgi:hypothetical protein
VLAVTTVVWGARAGRRGTLPRSVALALGLTGPLVVVSFGLTNFGPVVAAAVACCWPVRGRRYQPEPIDGSEISYGR